MGTGGAVGVTGAGGATPLVPTELPLEVPGWGVVVVREGPTSHENTQTIIPRTNTRAISKNALFLSKSTSIKLQHADVPPVF